MNRELFLNTEKYIIDYPKLEACDIILTAETSPTSKVVRGMTLGKYSHAAIYVGGTTIEATLKGVFSKNPQRIVFDRENQVAIFRSKRALTEVEIRKICEYARSQVGSLYALSEAITIRGRSLLRMPETRKQFCSRLVAKSYEAAGYDLANLRNPAYCTPKQLGLCKSFYQVQNIIRRASDSEVSFANSPDPALINLQHTFEWLNKVRDLVLWDSNIKDIEIQTINDVSDFLLKYPQFDANVSAFIEATGYLHFYNYDAKASPFRYNDRMFREVVSEHPDPDAFMENELDKEVHVFYPASVNLEGYIALAKQQKLRFFTLHIQLYVNIIKGVYARLKVIIAFYESIGEDEINEEVQQLKNLNSIVQYAIAVGETALQQ